MGVLAAKETLMHREAFEFFYALPEPERDFDRIAVEFDVKRATVVKWAHDYAWKMMAHDRDQEVAARIAEDVIETVAATKIKYHKMVRSTIEKWFKTHFDAGQMEKSTLLSMRANDVRDLIKLDLELLGHQDVKDKLEGKSAKEADAGKQVKQLSTQELRQLIELNKRAIEADVASGSGSSASGVGSA